MSSSGFDCATEMNRVFFPRRFPSKRNCKAKVDFPVPGAPSTSMIRPVG